MSHRQRLFRCHEKACSLICKTLPPSGVNRYVNTNLIVFSLIVQIDEKSFDNGTITHKIAVVPSANLSVTCTVSNSFGIDTRVINVSSLFEDVRVDKRGKL
ncbi:hypothetical protein XENORESO_020664 [Xenotaenia resolanae]|uniref:Uncharacterized protein n=1 Tax=Xenotaenia resolanae TaxID=208358 RepID=A0ABV0WN21_9TELE